MVRAFYRDEESDKRNPALPSQIQILPQWLKPLTNAGFHAGLKACSTHSQQRVALGLIEKCALAKAAYINQLCLHALKIHHFAVIWDHHTHARNLNLFCQLIARDKTMIDGLHVHGHDLRLRRCTANMNYI